MSKTIRLTESKLNEMITSIMEEIMNNGTDGSEFTFSDTKELRPGVHQQQIFYMNEFVGYLSTREKNPLAPIEEYYHIPDVDKGIDEQGYIDFRIFKNNDEEALNYTKENFGQIVYLIKNGNWD